MSDKIPEMSMSDKIPELLNRNLQEVFGEGDAARRRAVIDELYTEDCVLYVPVGIFVGRDALESRKRSIMPAAWPGGRVRAAKGPTIPAWT